MDIIISILAFIVALGLLVTFHEYGHFYVARKFGVKVIRFSVGFGKPLLRWRSKKDGTDYVLAAIPLGGYVKMLDEREGPVPEHLLNQAFNRKSVWARSAIVLAGPFFNFIFAVFAYWLMFMIGTTGVAPIIGKVLPDSIAEKHGLTSKLEFVDIDGRKTNTWQAVNNGLLPTIGNQDVEMTFKHFETHEEFKHILDLSDFALDSQRPNPLTSLGVEPYRPSMPAVIGMVVEGEPAEAGGIKVGDTVLSVNDKPIYFWDEFVREIHKYPNQQVALSLLRNNSTITLDVTPRENQYNGETVGYLGVVIKPSSYPEELIRVERYGIVESFVKGVDQTGHYISLTLKMLGKLLTGKIGLETVSGPITIAQGAGATVQVGFAYYLGFLGLISVSLGVINLLPIPILDGGHLLFYVIEILRGKPPSDKFMQMSLQIGMLLLIGLMTLAFYNDFIRLAHQ